MAISVKVQHESHSKNKYYCLCVTEKHFKMQYLLNNNYNRKFDANL